MEKINIKGTEDTPGILFDTETKQFEITGRSLPEDVTTFYAPVMKWLEEFEKSVIKDAIFEIKLEYFNTASSKILLDILMKLESINEKTGSNFTIKWYYDNNDEDMQEAGEEYKELVENLKFEILAM